MIMVFILNSKCHVLYLGGVMSGALYLGGVMTSFHFLVFLFVRWTGGYKNCESTGGKSSFRHTERFCLFTKRFRKFRWDLNWTRLFGSFHWKFFLNKRNFGKGSPVQFPVEISQRKFVFHLQISRLYYQFHTFRGPFKPLLTEIPK